MKFLVTNDDGIDAAGLAALITAAEKIGDPVVVAPANPQSGVSHAVTWREGVKIEQRSQKRFAVHGTPGIAVSHYYKAGLEYNWDRAASWVGPILGELLAKPIDPGLFYNVNLPHLGANARDPEVVWCELDPNPLPLNYRHEEESGLYFAGDYRLRERTPGADVDVCFSGSIAVTPVRLL